MAPKRVAEVLGDVTPRGSSPSGSGGDKGKKEDTDNTPTPVVDKDVTPSEDDKKKKDTLSTQKKGVGTTTTPRRASQSTQHTELTELSEGSRGVAAGKRKDMGKQPGRVGATPGRRATKSNKIFNKKLKDLRRTQKKKNMKLKHPRSFSSNIMRILHSVNDTQEAEALPHKRVNQLSMMIFDSFANDLCDKLIATGVELLKNTGRRQLGSGEIKAAMKLVLPPDMASCAEEAVQASLVSYKSSTRKFQNKIAKSDAVKKSAAGTGK